MNLNKLRIDRAPSYAKNAGEYEGVAVFDDEAGSVTLKLTPEHCNEIFRICADGIIDTAKKAATSLTSNILEHQKALEEGQ